MKTIFPKIAVWALMLAAATTWSCDKCDHVPYDDTEIKEQIADLYSKLAALEARLTTEMQAVQQMISGRTAIASYTQDAEGNWVLTLTDGKSITVYDEYEPEALPSSLVYVMEVEIDGVATMVWATMGTDGQLTPIMDGSDYIPVAPEEVEMPTIPTLEYKVQDGSIWIKLSNSDEWIETGMTEDALDGLIGQGNCACGITDVELNKVKDVVVSMTFTLADGSTFTVAVKLENVFTFTLWNDSIDSFYLAAGATESENLDLRHSNLVDFIKEVPQGWTVKFGDLDFYGDKFPVTLTAPTAEAIAAGTAVAQGTIKLIGVFEGGESAVAKLEVTTNPFKEVSVSSKGDAYIEPYNGVDQFVYGILPASEFSAETVKTTLETTYLPNGLWAGWEAPYNASSYWQVIQKPASDIYGQDLNKGESYVLWYAALNRTSNYFGDEFQFSLASEIFQKSFSQVLVEAEATSVAFNDIRVKINFLGFSRYYGGIVQSTAFNKEGFLTEINQAHAMGQAASLTSYHNDSPTNETSLTFFPCSNIDNIQFNTKYTMWIIPVETGKTVYSEEDMYVFEWTSGNLEAGGTMTVTETEGTLVADYTKLSVGLNNNPDAYALYYKWYKTAELPAEDELALDVLSTGAIFDPAEGVVSAFNLAYNTSYTLVVVPLSAEGQYGSVCTFEHKTLNISFSETFKLTAEQMTLPVFEAPTAAQFRLTTEGAAGSSIKYYYMNLTDAEVATWGGEDAIAAELALGAKFKRKTAWLTDGAFKITGLVTGTQYTLYALALDGSVYTKMQKVTYTPQASDINIIPATDARWEASKPTVTFESVTPPTSSFSSNYTVKYTVTPAAGMKVSGGTYINNSIKGETFDKLAYMLTRTSVNYYIKDITEAASFEKAVNPKSASVFVTWTDAEGNYYEPMQVTIPVE